MIVVVMVTEMYLIVVVIVTEMYLIVVVMVTGTWCCGSRWLQGSGVCTGT